MNLMFFLILLIFPFSSLFAQGDDVTCTGEPVRLDSRGGKMENVAYINQHDLGICYACAAAQAAAAAHGVSGHCPLAIAADNAARGRDQKDGDNNALEDSNICPAINAANRAGYCTDCGPLYQALGRHDGGNDFFDRLNDYFNQFRLDHNPARRQSWATTISTEETSQFYSQMCSLALEDVRPTIRLPSRDILITSMRDNNPGLFFGAMLESSCTPRAPAAGGRSPTCNNVRWPTKTRSRQLLRNHFTSNQVMPLGVEYCSNVFNTSKPSEFITYSGDLDHGSLTAFRNWDENEDKFKFMLEQYDRRVTRKMNDIISTLQSERPATELEILSQTATLNYVTTLKNCLVSQRDILNRGAGRSSTRSNFFEEGTMINAPFTQILRQALESSCGQQVRDLRDALPAESAIATSYREAVRSMIIENEEAAQSERDCGGHASLIIGKRCLNGKFQYLVRNTWGQDCDGYSNTEGNGSMECEAATSSIWIDEDIVINNTETFNVIE
jgi:hypothetical protein